MTEELTSVEAYTVLRSAVVAHMASEAFMVSAEPFIAAVVAAVLGAKITSSGPAAGGMVIQARLSIGGRRRSISANRGAGVTAKWAKWEIIRIAFEAETGLSEALEAAAVSASLALVQDLPAIEAALRGRGHYGGSDPLSACRSEASTQVSFAMDDLAWREKALGLALERAAALGDEVVAAIESVPEDRAAAAANRAERSRATIAFRKALNDLMAAGVGDSEIEVLLNEARVKNVMES
jgi:hypothetical protein